MTSGTVNTGLPALGRVTGISGARMVMIFGALQMRFSISELKDGI